MFDRKFRNMKSSMKSAFTILITLIILSTSSCKFIKEKGWFGKSEPDTMAVWLARQDSIRLADSIKAAEERARAAEQARIDSIEAAEQAQREYEERFKYHIIVGSFLTPEYADDYLEYYKSLGYTDAQIIEGPSQRFNLVSAEAHDNLSRALNRLYQYQDTVEFAAWVYIND